MRKLISIFVLIIVPIIISAQYYCAPTGGDDSNPGTIDLPWATWQKAFETAEAGDTVYFRGGVWYPQDHSFGNAIVIVNPALNFGHTGTRESPICFFNYPNETPILDCSQVDMEGNSFNSALDITGVGWYHVKGLTVRNVVQPESQELASGIGVGECHNMIFENTVVHDVGGRGMTYWGVAGHPEYPSIATDTTRFINCDIYDCVDWVSEVPGNGSDGVKMDAESGTYLYFYGCRAWGNGDDGFDISGPGRLIFDNCWAFEQGFEGALDGNGFKFGANRGIGATQDSIGNTHVGPNVTGIRRIVKNCISAGNMGLGLYDLAYAPYYPNESRIYNNSLYSNGISISISINEEYNGINPPRYYNNIAHDPDENTAAGYPYYLSVAEFYEAYNNTFRFAPIEEVGSLPWFRVNEAFTVTDDDFVSLDISQLYAPRKSDGSLPDVTFMKLSENSDLREGGLNVETVIASELREAGVAPMAFSGTAPNLGAWQDDSSTGDKPVSSFSTNKTEITEGQSVSFDASLSSDSDGSIVSYSWNFGDGNTGSGQTVNHTYSSDGVFTALLTVTDNDNNSSSTSVVITVNQYVSGLITNTQELTQALQEAQSGDVLELSSNTFAGDIDISVQGDVVNRITITAASGFSPVFTDSVTISSHYLNISNVSFSGTVYINRSSYIGLTNNTFVGDGNKIEISQFRGFSKGRYWNVSGNTFDSIRATFNGVSYWKFRNMFTEFRYGLIYIQ